MRSTIKILAVIMICVSFTIITALSETINVVYNGVLQPEDEMFTIYINQTILVSVRSLCELLGANVAWDGKMQKIIIVEDGNTIELTIDNRTAYVNGIEKTLDEPPVLQNEKALVPIRFVCEALGATVGWDEHTNSVKIESATFHAERKIDYNKLNQKEPVIYKTYPSYIPVNNNLIDNGGFEDLVISDLKPGHPLYEILKPSLNYDMHAYPTWERYSGGRAQIADDPVHTGFMAMKVDGRQNTWDGVMYKLTEKINKAGSGSYKFEGWMRSSDGDTDGDTAGWIKIRIDNGQGEYTYFQGTGSITDKEWTYISFTADITLPGDKATVYLIAETSGKKVKTFYLDDLSLIKQ